MNRSCIECKVEMSRFSLLRVKFGQVKCTNCKAKNRLSIRSYLFQLAVVLPMATLPIIVASTEIGLGNNLFAVILIIFIAVLGFIFMTFEVES